MFHKLQFLVVASLFVFTSCDSSDPVNDSDSGFTPDANIETTADVDDDVSSMTPDTTLDVATEDMAADTGPDLPIGPVDVMAPYLKRDRVLEVSITMKDQDWTNLRNETRSFADLRAGEDCLDKPFPGPFNYYPGDVTIDGTTVGMVGIRKKGFLGSLDTYRPSLKLKYDRYVDDQLLDGVVERMTLNNGKQDRTKMAQCLTFDLYNAAGIPAPRCNFAKVTVNGEYLGLYNQIEPVKKRFLRQHFASDEGKLYEGTLSDFNGWLGTIEQKTNEDGDFQDVNAIRDALALPEDQYLAALEELIDVDQFITFWALEVIIGHWDGYAGNRNNFYIYAEPGKKFVFLPWGVDQTFRTLTGRYNGDPQTVLARGELSFRMYNDPAIRPIYEARIRTLLDTVWHVTNQLTRVAEMTNIIETHERDDYRGGLLNRAGEVRDFIRERRRVMLNELDAGGVWSNGLPNPDSFCRP